MKPIINPDYPIAMLASVDDLMAIAVGMEHEAATRYENLADAMEARGQGDLAALFRQLAELEREHESGLGRWATREGRAVPSPRTFPWRLPETFGDAADGARAHTLTPYRALSIAVENEERAFTFYSYLAALADQPEIRLRAEALAREELAHVQQLRALRRRAFHMEHPTPRGTRRAADVGELASLAHGLELASAEVDEACAAAVGNPAALLLGQQAGAARLRVAGFADAPPGPGSASAEGARAAGLLASGTLTSDGALTLALRNAEEVAEIYMASAEHASDERVMHQAQELAEQAMARLAIMRSLVEREPVAKGQ